MAIELKFIGKDIGEVNQQILAYANATGGEAAASAVGGAVASNDKQTEPAGDDKPRRSRKTKDDAPADDKKAEYPTLEELRAVAAKVPGDNEPLQDKAFELVEKLGASKLSEIKPEDRQEFIDGIEALLAGEGGKKSRRSLDD